jgi:multiple sugar transport system permease protein
MERNGLISNIDYKKTSNKVIYWTMIALLILVAVICILPVVWVLVSSLKSLDEFYSVPPTLWPKSFHFEAIPELFGKYDFTKLYWNTIILCAGNIFFSIIINGFMGYSLSKLKVKGGAVVFSIILATYMLPTTVSMAPVYKNIIKFPIIGINLLNTNWPMWLMAGANAYFVILYKSFFDSLPSSLLEAAKLDGCGDFGTFIHVVAPLSKPIIATTAIMSFSGAWGDFFWPYMVLKDVDVQTIMVKIYAMQGNTSIGINTLLLAITFSIIPPAIVFVIFQKKIMNGFTMSGIKG